MRGLGAKEKMCQDADSAKILNIQEPKKGPAFFQNEERRRQNDFDSSDCIANAILDSCRVHLRCSGLWNLKTP